MRKEALSKESAVHEFDVLLNTALNEEFLERTYTLFLNRKIDAIGKAGHGEALRMGIRKEEIIYNII